jgi:hypothetical protein
MIPSMRTQRAIGQAAQVTAFAQFSGLRKETITASEALQPGQGSCVVVDRAADPGEQVGDLGELPSDRGRPIISRT